MSELPDQTRFEEILDDCEYPREAIEFVQHALTYAVETTHGKPSESEKKLFQIMDREKLDYSKLCEAYHAGQLDEEISELVDRLGGLEKINRHISGQQLCRGIRDLALKRWGCMAPAVLTKWRIHATIDIGKIVFFLVEHSFLQKQEADQIKDFENVFDFKTSFGPNAVFENSTPL